MTKVVRFNVVNKEPVELEINDASEIDALNDVQVQKLYDALGEFLSFTPIEDKELFDRIVESGCAFFYASSSDKLGAGILLSDDEQD